MYYKFKDQRSPACQ